MSLLPPPWELLTTKDPFFKATLERPPGHTFIPSEPYIANGLKSTHLGVSSSSMRHGVVEILITGWAIKFFGFVHQYLKLRMRLNLSVVK